jgi:glycosyltransferase involved in cell wall biosynthesis
VARRAGVMVASLPFNLGIGAALRTGFRYAVEHGYERAVQFDADGQHDPRQIAHLLSSLEQGADLVIGSRFRSGEASHHAGRVRLGAMKVLCLVVRILSGTWFSDTSSGFRAFSRPMLQFFAANYPAEYMESTESLLMACHAGFRVTEVPVAMRAREAGLPSQRSFRLLYSYVRVLIALLSSARLHPPGRETTI